MSESTLDVPRKAGWKAFAQHLVRQVRQDDLPGIAATLAYYSMLSLFPALILLVALIDFLPIQISVEDVKTSLQGALPKEAAQLVTGYLEEFIKEKPSGAIGLWALVVLWSASKGIARARVALNVVFDVFERRSAILLRLVSVLMTVGIFLFIGVAYILLVSGPQAGEWLVRWVGLGHTFAGLWAALRLPMVVTLLTLFLLLAYRYLPQRRLPFRYLLAGAVPAVAGWMLIGQGLRLWFKHFGDSDLVYQGLTSVIVLLIFLWAISLIFLFGAEVATSLAGVRLGRLPKPRPRSQPPS